MFTKKITDADAFTALPPTTQALYFHLCMDADDDGFNNKIRQAMFNGHADQNDFNLLVQHRFILPFESGVIVIKHWKMHNIIRNDRYHETEYIEEKARLVLKKNGAYTELDNQVSTKCQPDDNQMEPEVRIGKDNRNTINSISCTEPLKATVPALILNTGEEWTPTVDDYEEWCRLYPNVDVSNEFGRMRQWCISNPSKRKTARGVRRFAQTWLDREQNSSRRSAGPSKDKLSQKFEEMKEW